MHEFFSNAGANAVGGLVAAVVFALLLWTFNLYRSRQLEQKLCGFLKPQGFAMGVDGIGVMVDNKGSSTVIVRSVRLQFPQVGDVILHYRPDNRAMAVLPSGTLEQQAQAERGFVALPAKCEGLWLLPPFPPGWGFVTDPNTKVLGCRVTFEYRDLLGQSKVVAMEADKDFVANVDGAFQLMRKEHPEFLQRHPHLSLFGPGANPVAMTAVAE